MVTVKVGSAELVLPRTRVDIEENRIFFVATPCKGEEGEEQALESIQTLKEKFDECEISHQVFERNTPTGDRVDVIVIKAITKE